MKSGLKNYALSCGENQVILRLLVLNFKKLTGITLSCNSLNNNRSVVVYIFSSCIAWLHWKNVSRLTLAAHALVSVQQTRRFSSFLLIAIISNNIYTTSYCSLENVIVDYGLLSLSLCRCRFIIIQEILPLIMQTARH